MPDAPAPDDDERRLFREAVGEVTPVAGDRVERRPPPPPAVPRSRLEDERRVLHDMVSDYFEPAEVETGEHIHYLREGVQWTVLRKLRRGQFSVGAQLDLHGLSWHEARIAIHLFIGRVRRERAHCVRIIHGKGNRSQHRGPVLKHKLNVYLRKRDDILAFCSARPHDGGTGAIYVLLRSL